MVVLHAQRRYAGQSFAGQVELRTRRHPKPARELLAALR
jgi:hypothetical protein